MHNLFSKYHSQTRKFLSLWAKKCAKPLRGGNRTTVIGLSLYFFSWLAYFFWFWSHAFIVNGNGGVSAQHVNLWGDWAAHFTIGSALAERGLVLTSSPFLLDAPFSYPFVADMLSAILLRLNVDIFTAFVVPSFIFSFLLVVALFLFYVRFSKSVAVAVLASMIFLFNGGTGFSYYIHDIITNENKIETALNPPRDYTNIEDQHYRWISVITSMVYPQRAFTMGFPLALILLTLILTHIEEEKRKKKPLLQKVAAQITQLFHRFLKKIPKTPTHSFIKNKSLFFAVAALLGLMPIIHTHSFLALFIVLFFWMSADLYMSKKANTLKKSVIQWGIFVAIVAAIALPLIHIFIATNVSSSFIQWYPGWYVGNDFPDETLLSFWFKNWAVIPLLSVVGLVVVLQRSKEKVRDFLLYLPFFVLFIVTNLFLFQPFVWDNTKILVWASLGFSLLAAQALVHFWHRSAWFKPLVVVIAFVSMFSGFLDAYRAIRFDLHSYEMYSAEELELADWAKNNTETDSIWVTGTYHNQWLFNLTGRQAVATYTGWLWTHGYDYYDEDWDIQTLYKHPQTNSIVERYGIDYVVVGPFEKRSYKTSESLFTEGYSVAKETPNYTVFKKE